MKTLDPFLESIRAGAALAGLLAGACNGFPGSEDNSLPALPSGEPVCTGPDYGDGPGFYGQCCQHLICRQMVDGVCPVGNDGKFYGSGTCLCGSDHPIQGPYAVDPADPATATARAAGPCCYLTSSIRCDGRPIHVDDSVRIAAVVARGDWC